MILVGTEFAIRWRDPLELNMTGVRCVDAVEDEGNWLYKIVGRFPFAISYTDDLRIILSYVLSGPGGMSFYPVKVEVGEGTEDKRGITALWIKRISKAA